MAQNQLKHSDHSFVFTVKHYVTFSLCNQISLGWLSKIQHCLSSFVTAQMCGELKITTNKTGQNVSTDIVMERIDTELDCQQA